MASYAFGIMQDISYVTPTAGDGGKGGPNTFVPDYADQVGSDGKTTKVLTQFTNCVFMFGRKFYDAGTIPTPTLNGPVYAVITHPTAQAPDEPPSVTIDNVGGDSDNLKTVVPLYELEDGNIKLSYRDMPYIPVYN